MRKDRQETIPIKKMCLNPFELDLSLLQIKRKICFASIVDELIRILQTVPHKVYLPKKLKISSFFAFVDAEIFF